MPSTTAPTLTDLQQDISNNIAILEADKPEVKLKKAIDDCRIDDSTSIREIVPVVTIAESIFAVKGDISIVGGLPKTGKTSVCSYLLATALMENIPDGFDTLGIRTSFAQGHPVIYVDTEQPQAYTNRLRKSILKILNRNNHPKNLLIYNLRKHSSDMKRSMVKEIIRQNPHVHLLIVDGVADLIKDPNDTKEAFGIVEEMMIASDQYDTAIILHIHENPGTAGKLRGNLGSEAERKCGGAITIKKIKQEKGVHSIESKLIRGSADFEPIFFRYDTSVGRMVSLNADEAALVRKSADKTLVKERNLRELAKTALLLGSLKYKDLIATIRQKAPDIEGKPITDRTAATRVKEMLDKGIVSKSENGQLYVYEHI